MNHSKVNVSFEFFPPKNEEAISSLWQNINRLEPLKPRFISVTYGAGGSTRENTHNLVKQIKKKTDLQPAAHLTCINSTKEEIELIANDYWTSGIKHIVALRGDPPKNISSVKSDFKYATDLIGFLRKKYDFEITVSAYPEIHPDSDSIEQEYDILKKKNRFGCY